jgi:hypothetical protein
MGLRKKREGKRKKEKKTRFASYKHPTRARAHRTKPTCLPPRQVYDTTLDISLAADQTKWLDDFGLKGPSPNPNPRSWDKSPVANGAHYFL